MRSAASLITSTDRRAATRYTSWRGASAASRVSEVRGACVAEPLRDAQQRVLHSGSARTQFFAC
eukprot:4945688-Prymnesium_polylepis.1